MSNVIDLIQKEFHLLNEDNKRLSSTNNDLLEALEDKDQLIRDLEIELRAVLGTAESMVEDLNNIRNN